MVANTSSLGDAYVPLSEVPNLPEIPARRRSRRTGRPSKMHKSCPVRWGHTGVLTPDGRRVKLRVVKIGGTPCTTRAWLRQFFEAAAGTAPTPPAADPQADAAADAVLQSAGI